MKPDFNRMIRVARHMVEIRVPWKHNHRSLLGIDCLNFLIYLLEEQGLTHVTLTPYSETPNGRHMHAVLSQFLDEIPFDEAQPGDILQIRVRKNPQHLAMISQLDPYQIIHADRSPGINRVAETVLSDDMRSRVYATFRLRNDLPMEINV